MTKRREPLVERRKSWKPSIRKRLKKLEQEWNSRQTEEFVREVREELHDAAAKTITPPKRRRYDASGACRPLLPDALAHEDSRADKTIQVYIGRRSLSASQPRTIR
jgi:hypothetical protein